jgi:hypothetical protein
MQFNFKFGTKKELSRKRGIVESLGYFWHKIYKTIFFIFLFIMIIVSAYVWNMSLSGGEWSAEKKQKYLDAQSSGVNFNENNYKKVLVDIELRKKIEWANEIEIKDIFKSY